MGGALGIVILLGTLFSLLVIGMPIAYALGVAALAAFAPVTIGADGGFVYSAIPGSGLVMLLFVIETAIFGPPEDDEDEELQRVIDHADHEQRTLA